MPDLSIVPPLLLIAVGLIIGFLLAWIYLLLWKTQHSQIIRKDAVERSRATISGQIYEQLIPYLPDFPFDPKDVRFMGAPIDLVVFDGLSAGALERIVFVEVKTGQSTLTPRERQLRDVVQKRRIDWVELRREG